MKITLDELKKLYSGHEIVLDKSLVTYPDGKTMKNNFRLKHCMISIDKKNDGIFLHCLQRTKTRNRETRSYDCGFSITAYKIAAISDIETIYLTDKNDDQKILTLIGKYTSAQFEIFN